MTMTEWLLILAVSDPSGPPSMMILQYQDAATCEDRKSRVEFDPPSKGTAMCLPVQVDCDPKAAAILDEGAPK